MIEFELNSLSHLVFNAPFFLCLWVGFRVYNFPFERGRGSKWVPTCFPNPFQAFERSNWNHLSKLHARATTYSLLRVRCMYNLHICTFKEQSMDSPPNNIKYQRHICIYFTMQSNGCYVAKTKKTNSYLNYGFEQCWVSLITTTSRYLKNSKSKNHWLQVIGKRSESKNFVNFQLFRKPQWIGSSIIKLLRLSFSRLFQVKPKCYSYPLPLVNCTYKLDTYFCNMESFANLVKEIMYNVILN